MGDCSAPHSIVVKVVQRILAEDHGKPDSEVLKLYIAALNATEISLVERTLN
ncbi:hypothetical protein [Acidicapsa acidisoli]|uniref:hypothetical protein n=1 Tax=Acidicapsa acidisoli TaxID=1615681 RepID=UPI0021E092E8|nr:hypothetical protein [Acidicapsa acidisoli]